jgi:hypothetical protein
MKSALICLLATVLLCGHLDAAPGVAVDEQGDGSPRQLCPGTKATCKADATCCSTGSGDAAACCPLKNAVCCADGVHCCPAGTSCNVDRATCDTIPANNATVRPAVRKQQRSSPNQDPVQLFQGAGVTCPDRSQCPLAGAACCRMSGSGRFGCCNYPLNVCCDDGYHCCHTGTVCDQLRLLCVPYPSAVDSQPWTQLAASASSSLEAAAAAAVEAVQLDAGAKSKDKAEYIVCPNGSTCPDLNTCCPLASGGYGCCPYYLATCCQDRLHCCPYGKHCTDTGLCVGDGPENLPWSAFNARKP